MFDNLIHFNPESIGGNLLNRYIRNLNTWPTELFSYKDFLIENVDESLSGKSIIVWSTFFNNFDGYKRHFEKFKSLLSCDNFIFVIIHESECAWGNMFSHVWNKIGVKDLPVKLQKKVYLTSYDYNSKNTYEGWKKESKIESHFNSVFIDEFMFENLDVRFENEEVVHREQFESKDIRPYYYVCYNNNPKDHRVRLVKDLQENNLDKLGLISLLRKENPLVLDRESVDHAIAIQQAHPIEHYCKTYFSIVTESYFRDWNDNKPEYYAHISGLSEKTYKGVLLNPFIILGGFHSLKHLRGMGFETFPELFDESYDEIFDPKLRYERVFKSIQDACNMDKKKLNDLYHSVLVDKVKFNQDLYINYDRKKYFEKFMRQLDWNIR